MEAFRMCVLLRSPCCYFEACKSSMPEMMRHNKLSRARA